jgi:hypothetical protein
MLLVSYSTRRLNVAVLDTSADTTANMRRARGKLKDSPCVEAGLFLKKIGPRYTSPARTQPLAQLAQANGCLTAKSGAMGG